MLAAIGRVFDTPVTMMMELADDLGKMQALRIGADDYTVKLFNSRKSLCERRTLKKGQVITIEPFLSLGLEWATEDKDDGWTLYADTGAPTVQYEHTVVVTPKGYEILT
ncbi:M24 family metallopeptidase [Thalassospira sp. TSL5-1]|uniref:M24 family metallopeptidase n=1 Tax=Thalassospira sp. TSL5-1 TaxID=1544451 RepID=UPI00093F9EA2|nr:M24 family metallopeptidase [Thalassospira sp. TSL5-1]OKH88576.1 hypothetical protein LF95_00165 [Thalassospira sp. TSL5-1]